MSQTYWQRLWPPRPVVPPVLWLALGLEAVAGLNLFFWAEIWSPAPGAHRLAQAAPLLGGIGIIGGSIKLLWQWADAYAGPGWARLLLQGAVLSATTVLVIFAIFLAFAVGMKLG